MSEEVKSVPISDDEMNKDSIEKAPTKTKRPYKWTEARKQAFERCRKARSEQVKTIRKKKVIDAGLAPPPEQPSNIPSTPATKVQEQEDLATSERIKSKTKTKTKRKVIVYQSDSSSSESSESDIEIEVRRKPKSSRSKPVDEERHISMTPYQQILTWI